MSQNSETTERYLEDGFWRYGRFYGSWKPGKYLFPIDSEELNRQDIFHKFFLVARDDKPYAYPLRSDPPPKILDLGTGTAIWAINVAEDFAPGSEMVAVDLNQIQPLLIPRGLTIKQFDIEEPSWDPLQKDCDLIHIRMLFGAIRADLWPQVYRNVFEHLAPGRGYVEHTELDWTPHWDGEELPPRSALREWIELYYTSMDHYNRKSRVIPNDTKRLMEAAGLTDFKEEIIKCYVNPWSRDKHEREIARWFNLGFCHSIEAMSFTPMVEGLGMPFDQVRDMCARVKKEICVLRYHAYCHIEKASQLGWDRRSHSHSVSLRMNYEPKRRKMYYFTPVKRHPGLIATAG
ncbi:protein LAE1 [Paramyrothecium foliicola]|nr:protein LAE1 [Paramyrothecium foliicola]